MTGAPCTQDVLPMFCKKKSFRQRFTCTYVANHFMFMFMRNHLTKQKSNRLLLRNRCGEPKHFQMHSDNRIYFPYFSLWLTQNIISAILLCIAYCLFFGSLFFNTFHRLSPQRPTRYTMRINHHESFLSNYGKPVCGAFSLE